MTVMDDKVERWSGIEFRSVYVKSYCAMDRPPQDLRQMLQIIMEWVGWVCGG